MRRSGRSALFSRLQRAFAAARRENQLRAGVRPQRIDRRPFLAGAAAGALAAYSSPARAAGARVGVAAVGAGIAGLNATRILSRAGIDVTLYEGSDHIGGRIQTNYGLVAPNVYTELGGEFIDSDHDDMLGLARMY